jgi:predicted lipid-binding transport protein (Tim44 family)
MKHVLFALFATEEDAQAAVREIEAQASLKGSCTLLLHRGEINRQDVPIEETGAREGLTTGALVGTAVGGVMGGLMFGPLGLLSAGPLAGALFGMLGGGAMGALGGGLSGAAEPDPVLEEIGQEVAAGKVLLTVEPTARAQVDDIERICLAHGGRIARKPAIGFWTHRMHPRRDAA